MIECIVSIKSMSNYQKLVHIIWMSKPRTYDVSTIKCGSNLQSINLGFSFACLPEVCLQFYREPGLQFLRLTQVMVYEKWKHPGLAIL